MFIDDLIWLSDIIEKLAWKHNVIQDEVEEVLCNKPQFRFIEKGYRTGEDVYAALGQTDSGRYLIVIFINKPNHMALIVSARDMDAKERRHYEHH
ncbi:MAG: hypothetical protein A2511_17155 [Deltaproteobacteria bacterium RIFOXYD12_FULL_50_9]|nr:MAG: hypothetical protein A2511_17155 [Deltaproteobacteria bacterium RIFOXYD12_FULL_50_9]